MKKIKPTTIGNLSICSVAALPLMVSCSASEAKPQLPNVIVILADDMGVGDMSVYGATAISTPALDKLANGGVRFNQGYATSATSTPSRYALMTGEYPWKNPDAKILPGDAPLLIDVDQYTLPKMMQEAGYSTAAIGKWHLGMGAGNVNWNEQISPSANDIGFDYSCLIAATNDRVPTVYVEDGKVVGLEADDPIYVNYKENFEGEPTAISHPELMKMEWDHGHNQSVMNGIPRIGYQTGGKAAHWVDEDMADYFVGKVKEYVSQKSDEPFFLYYGLHQPHVPRAPHSRFVGSTDLGPRGDAVVEADWCVGELIAHLEKEGLLENTIIFYSSDNGPVLNDGYKDMAVENSSKHDQLAGLRGGKYSLFEGGTRVPFMVYWKGTIEPLVSDAMVCQIDIMPSIAALLGLEIPAMDGEDMLAAFTGESLEGRTSLIHEANSKLSYRSGKWGLIPPYKGAANNVKNIEMGTLPEITLWDLEADPSQQNNVAAQYPEVAEALWSDFTEITKGYYNPQAVDFVFGASK